MPYRLWREAVFKRDDYTCQNCGKRGGKLNADHIKLFALFPELRFKVSNGRTLCNAPCHRLTDTYGGRVARLKTEIVKMPQVFLPFAQDASGKTAYEVMLEGKFLLGPGPDPE